MSTKTTTTTTTVAGRSSSTSGEFDVAAFEKRLWDLKDTQDSVQQLSSWCLSKRAHHKKIVSSWLNVLKQVKIESRLTLFHLANDVIQYSKRKNYEFVDSWGTYLQKATTLVRDEKVKHKILRIFKIWEQRDIYNEEFLADLIGLLSVTTSSARKLQQQQQQQQQLHQQQQHHASSSSATSVATLATGPTKLVETKSLVSANNAQLDVDDYQAPHLVAIIHECVKQQSETDQTFKGLNKKPHVDVELVMSSIKGKDRKRVEENEHELEEELAQYENFVKVLKTEQKLRRELLTVLDQAQSFYDIQRTEVKVVVNAYSKFGGRLKSMKKRLDELTTTLPSPIPSPDINAPSPVPSDGDNILPNDESYFQMHQHHRRSYMDGGMLPFDINDFNRSNSPLVMNSVQPIEVIHSRKEESEGVNDFLKTFFPDPSGYHGQPVPSSSASSSAAQGLPPGGIVTPPQPPPGMVPHPYGGGNGGGVNPWASSTPRGNGPGGRPVSSVVGYGSRPPPPYGNPGMLTDYGNQQPPPGVGRNAGSSTAPLLPPPMPPLNLDESDEYNSTWDMPMTWDGTHDSSGFQSLDTTVSPSHYDRKGMNASNMLMDYGDGSSGDGGLQDVDHRQLPNNLAIPPPFAKDKGRLADVDHRNLISLTGSPGGPMPKRGHMMSANDMNMDDDGDGGNEHHHHHHHQQQHRSSSGSGRRVVGPSARNSAPQPVPAPMPSSEQQPAVWATGNAFSAASSDVDLRLAPPGIGSSSSALTVVPTTSGPDDAAAAGGVEESKDLDLRIQSLEKAIAAQIANNTGSSLVYSNSLQRLGDGIASDDTKPVVNDDSTQSDDDENGGVTLDEADAELSLPELQTPVSLLEIDDFLQNFERERFDLTKPPALLMSNQTESSQSPPPTSEHSGTGGDGTKNPTDNIESVDMDLSDEEAVEQQQQQPVKRSPQGATAQPGTDENSCESVEGDAGHKDEQAEAASGQAAVNNNGPASVVGGDGGGTAVNNITPNSSSTNSNSGSDTPTPPLLQRPPLLPDPTFAQGGPRPKWDLPPPSLMSLTGLGNFGSVLPSLVGNLSHPPPASHLPQIWADQPPPGGDVAGLFNSPNRPPPPLPFGSGGLQKGNNYRGGLGTPRGRGHHNRNAPYFRGGSMSPAAGLMMGGAGGNGSPGMRGGYRGGGGNGGKFRGGGGGGGAGSNRSGW